MKLHRFYIHEMHNKYGKINMSEAVWIHDEGLLNQWLKVLRYRKGDELVLFNDQEERLYKISDIEYPHSVKLMMITELERKLPTKKITLIWSILKKDKNDWVIQKATEIGVRDLVPVISDRSEKTNINIDRAKKIIVEASEQCGRSDIPIIREPILLSEALAEYSSNLFICEQGGNNNIDNNFDEAKLLIGPEGGWSDNEKVRFKELSLNHLAISNFTLRAETAAIVAISKFNP